MINITLFLPLHPIKEININKKENLLVQAFTKQIRLV